jgi:hypothetical protein
MAHLLDKACVAQLRQRGYSLQEIADQVGLARLDLFRYRISSFDRNERLKLMFRWKAAGREVRAFSTDKPDTDRGRH